MKKILCILMLSFSHTVFSSECKSVQFPFSQAQSKQDVANILINSNQDDIDQYLFFELTTSPESKLSPIFFDFLIKKEQDKMKRGFYKTLEWASKDDEGVKRALKLSEICTLYQKVN
ncbi:MAG: hypothetical protein CME71_08295 [Halobacteriovorax sp.]|nr:hypothetical protein [Halobacteriovorax sp.]|tara:strand:- start:75 stop:425 length:351 start_codon:yes stop_codon:yes gene_type:complete